ncbi:hypothetical protein A3Q56_03876, partial [Intoshia linei]
MEKVLHQPIEYYKYSEKERWITIYPAYINKDRTIPEGRRLNKSQCISEPLITEMLEAVKEMNAIIEDKVYCRERDVFDSKCRGRIRIQFKNDEGSYVNDVITSKKELMKHMTTFILKLKSRNQPLKKEKAHYIKK